MGGDEHRDAGRERGKMAIYRVRGRMLGQWKEGGQEGME